MAKKPKPTPSGESGAPAALEASAHHELRCRNEKDAAYDAWQTAKKNRNEDDDVSMRVYNRTLRDYLDVVEMWEESKKSLLAFDTKISPSRREGEKVLVEEAREIYRQLMLSVKLAIEACIIADAQSAALCDAPEQFHKAHAENYRAAMDGAIESAKSDGVLPGWITL